jgi:hypothetical protein
MSAAQELLAPLGYICWPARGDGDCAFHTMAFADGRFGHGCELVEEYRALVSNFLLAQAGSAVWEHAALLAGHAEWGTHGDAPRNHTETTCDPHHAAAVIEASFGLDRRRDAGMAQRLASVASAADVCKLLRTGRQIAVGERWTRHAAKRVRKSHKRGEHVSRSLADKLSTAASLNDFVASAGGAREGRLRRNLAKRFFRNANGRAPTAAELKRLYRARAFARAHFAKPPRGATLRKKRAVGASGKLGRGYMAPAMRRDLLLRFCRLRGAVKGRISLKYFRFMAQECKVSYLTAALKMAPDAATALPRAPVLSNRWLLEFRRQYRISLRLPNKRWKVSRDVLLERLRICWLNVYRVRRFIQLVFKYDPAVWSFDQKPFHRNEAGSKLVPTLAWKGQPCVELRENHSQTRDRWSCCTMAVSDFRAVAGAALPPMECVFKGGQGVRADLAACREQLRASGVYGDLEWLHVGATESGSYTTDDVIEYLKKVLPPWVDGRDWRLLTCDAYRPHDARLLDDLAWERGYVMIRVGGGTTGVVQVNDTHLHGELSRDYINAEMDDFRAQEELLEDAMPTSSREECIVRALRSWVKPSLHTKAAQGFLFNMFTNALDRSEDHLGGGDAKLFFDQSDMADLRALAVADVEAEFNTGALTWSFAAVQGLLEAFPRRGQMDNYEDGQEDEGYTVEEMPATAFDVCPDVSDADSEGDSAPAATAGLGAAPSVVENMPPSAYLAAQAQADELVVLDDLCERARSIPDPAALLSLQAVRKRAAKAASGTGAEASVADFVTRERERAEAAVTAKREELRLEMAKATHRKNAQAKLREMVDAVAAKRLALHTETAKIGKDAELATASKEYDANMFGYAKLNGGDKCHRSARWEAFRHLFSLVPGLTPHLHANLPTHWQRWDDTRRAESVPYPSLTYGLRYMNTLKMVAAWVLGGETQKAEKWWQQRVNELSKDALVLPAALAPEGAASS